MPRQSRLRNLKLEPVPAATPEIDGLKAYQRSKPHVCHGTHTARELGEEGRGREYVPDILVSFSASAGTRRGRVGAGPHPTELGHRLDSHLMAG